MFKIVTRINLNIFETSLQITILYSRVCFPLKMIRVYRGIIYSFNLYKVVMCIRRILPNLHKIKKMIPEKAEAFKTYFTTTSS